MARKRIDAAAVKQAAAGRWVEILTTAGISADLLDGRGYPCPKCGGTDRFAAHKDVADRGAVICRGCFAKGGGDGIATVAWFRDISNGEAIRWIAEYLGLTEPATTTPPTANGKPRIVATYQYRDEEGHLLFQVVRREPGADGKPKDFRQRRAKPKGGWDWSVKGVRVVPYHLPTLINNPDRPVAVVEGEKDADNLAKIGVIATCNAGGAGKWKAEHSKYLAGRLVVILPDNDDAGQDHAQQVARSLHGVAKEIRILELPDLPPKGDVSDWLAAGGTKDKLAELAGQAPVWTPQTAPDPKPVAPDPKPVAPEPKHEPPPYIPFPTDTLPEPVRDYVAQGAAALGCDDAYVALPVLAMLAAAVGTTRRIRLKNSWAEPCVLWAVTIGRSGTLKSPAWELAVRPLQEIQKEAFRRWGQEHDEWKRRQRQAKKSQGEMLDEDEPQPERYVCSDITVEAVATRLERNPRGLLMARDELSGWLSSFDAYKGARGADVAHWLAMHGARSLTVDRKTGRPTIYVPRAAVSIAGTVQPAILKLALKGRYEGKEDESTREHFANGLAARLLLAYPPPQPKRWTEDDLPWHVEQRMNAVVGQLLRLGYDPDAPEDFRPIDLALTPRGKRRFIEFVNAHADEQLGLNDDLAAVWSKLEGYAARLALLFHLVREAAGDTSAGSQVDEQDIDAGITLAQWFGDEAARTYEVIGGAADDEEARAKRKQARLIEWIRGRGGRVTVRDLSRGPRPYRGDSEAAEVALQGLVDAKLGKWTQERPSDSGGRPTRFFELIDAGDETPESNTVTGGDGDETPRNAQKTEVLALSPVSPQEETGVLSPPDADDQWGEV